MRILMVIPRYGTDVDQYYEFPLGLCQLAACAQTAGHEIVSLNLNHVAGDVAGHITRIIRTARPDVFATGGLSPHYALLRTLFSVARQADPHLALMGGGGIISSEPELMVRALGLDVGIIGEGEDALVDVLAVMQQNGDPRRACGSEAMRAVPGLCLGGLTPVLTAPRTTLANLDALPFPDYSIFGVEQYLDRQKPNDNYYLYPFDNPRILPIIASRSCPYSCTFYHNLFQFGQYPIRPRNAQTIHEENPDTVFIIMPCFANERLVKNLQEEFGVPEERLIYLPFVR